MNATVKFLADEQKSACSSKPAAGAFVPATALRDHDGKKIVDSCRSMARRTCERFACAEPAQHDGFLVDGLVGGER